MSFRCSLTVPQVICILFQLSNMRYVSLASGSSGNCGLLTDGKSALLIDAGISFKKIREGLQTQSMDICDVSAVFISHEHSDHIAALPMICKNTALPIYTRGGTARALSHAGKCPENRFQIISAESTRLGNITIDSMDTPHDAAEPVCYRFTGAAGSIGIVTDLGVVPESVARFLIGCKAVVLEFNHDVEMLRYGPYSYQLKQRILGNYGHLNNEYAAGFAKRLADTGTGQFLLAHLSAENNTPELAANTFLKYVSNRKMTVAMRKDVSEALQL